MRFAVTRRWTPSSFSRQGITQVVLRGSDPAYHLNSPSAAAPGYGVVAANWDGQWYELHRDVGLVPESSRRIRTATRCG